MHYDVKQDKFMRRWKGGSMKQERLEKLKLIARDLDTVTLCTCIECRTQLLDLVVALKKELEEEEKCQD